MDIYNVYKALHIIFVVTWFAGLFYIVRLFIYHTEANQKSEPEKSILINQYKIMERRLWFGITWPSMILAITFGTLLIYIEPDYLKMPFMHIKLSFVFFLILYHLSCQKIFNNLKKEISTLTSTKLRVWNELATLFLVSIVFLIVLKDSISFLWSLISFIVLSLVLMIGIKTYKKYRKS